MISKMAMEDIDSLADEGIKLTPQEIIRLNAFGLKVERATDAAERYALPRVAMLGKLTLRQPTIGSEIFLQKAAAAYDFASVDTWMTLRILSLSMDQSELPEPYDSTKMNELITALIEELRPLTYEQIITALQYATEGNCHWDGERKPPLKREDDDNDSIKRDDMSLEIGMMHDGLILKIGTIAEIKSLTTSSLRALIDYKREIDSGEAARKNDRNRALVDYYGILDELKKAHKERQSNG